MLFKDAPIGAILQIANSSTGPVYAKKIEAIAAGSQMAHNAEWVSQDGYTLCPCYIMDNQECEVVTLTKPKEKKREVQSSSV